MESSQRVAILYALLGKIGAETLIDGIARSGYRPDCLDDQLLRYVWTTEHPAEQAAYWYKESGICYLALTTVVFHRAGGSYMQATLMQIPWGLVSTRVCRVDALPGEWVGPLEVPE